MKTKKLFDNLFFQNIDNLLMRSITEDGGFAQNNGGHYRPDATAWAVMALSSLEPYQYFIKSACKRLTSNQLPDGRVVLIEGIDSVWWPTPLALLAWMKVKGFESEASKALNFLLNISGRHFPKTSDSPTGHDTKLKGWSWIENTHSWIEPTAISILALRAMKNEKSDRSLEAVRMILDRQLPTGGWNYGNTTVFSRELLPMPEHTGQALCALSGYVKPVEVQKSIEYLKYTLPALSTPLSLCWCLFGLSAWSVNVPDARSQILRCLSLQDKFGTYDTTLLAQLSIAYETSGDLLSFLSI